MWVGVSPIFDLPGSGTVTAPSCDGGIIAAGMMRPERKFQRRAAGLGAGVGFGERFGARRCLMGFPSVR